MNAAWHLCTSHDCCTCYIDQVSIARPKQTRESTRDANLYVADLPDSATEDELKAIFENYGKVYNCKLVVNAETGVSSWRDGNVADA